MCPYEKDEIIHCCVFILAVLAWAQCREEGTSSRGSPTRPCLPEPLLKKPLPVFIGAEGASCRGLLTCPRLPGPQLEKPHHPHLLQPSLATAASLRGNLLAHLLCLQVPGRQALPGIHAAWSRMGPEICCSSSPPLLHSWESIPCV